MQQRMARWGEMRCVYATSYSISTGSKHGEERWWQRQRVYIQVDSKCICEEKDWELSWTGLFALWHVLLLCTCQGPDWPAPPRSGPSMTVWLTAECLSISELSQTNLLPSAHAVRHRAMWIPKVYLVLMVPHTTADIHVAPVTPFTESF